LIFKPEYGWELLGWAWGEELGGVRVHKSLGLRIKISYCGAKLPG
jgi:hypothetical protein